MRKLLIFGGIAVGLVLMAVLANSNKDPAIEVRTEPAERGTIAKSVMASGNVNYRQNVALRTEVTGQIKEILVEEGQSVKAGDPLLTIDRTVFQAAVDQQKAIKEMRENAITRQEIQVEKLRARYERQKRLYETGVVGEDAYDALERDYEMAQVDLKSRKSELDQATASYDQSLDRLQKTTIRAPIDGIVTGLEAKIGETVVEGRSTMVGSSLMNVSDPSFIIAEVDVGESDILGIKLGQTAHVVTAADPNGYEVGVVTHIGTTARQVSNNNTSFKVKLHLKDSDPDLVRLGLSSRAEIFTDSVDSAVHIPVEAILYEDDNKSKPYVFLSKAGKSQKVMVKTGVTNDSRVQILDGVNEGDEVITGPYRLLKTLRVDQAVTSMDSEVES